MRQDSGGSISWPSHAHDLFLTYTLPFALAFLTVTGLYRLVPRRRPHWREAMIGRLRLACSGSRPNSYFVTYSTYATVYAHLYGSLLEVILLLLWVYYSAASCLIGAEVAHHLHQQAQALSAASHESRFNQIRPCRMVRQHKKWSFWLIWFCLVYLVWTCSIKQTRQTDEPDRPDQAVGFWTFAGGIPLRG